MPTPKQLVDEKFRLATEYSKLGEELTTLKVHEAKEMPVLMALHSVAKAQRIYDATEEGIQAMTIRIKMKSIEKLISAISSKLRVMENELRNMC